MKPSNLRLLRLKNGWSAAHVALALGVSDQWVYDVECGRRGLPAAHREKLEALYGQKVTLPRRQRAGKTSTPR